MTREARKKSAEGCTYCDANICSRQSGGVIHTVTYECDTGACVLQAAHGSGFICRLHPSQNTLCRNSDDARHCSGGGGVVASDHPNLSGVK
jgi:hypothetical protein